MTYLGWYTASTRVVGNVNFDKMGAFSCDIHGSLGIAFTCKHIVENIKNSVDEKCIMVKVQIHPKKGDQTINRLELPVCWQCFEDKRLSVKKKVKKDLTQLTDIENNYKVTSACALCIAEYAKRNTIDV